MRKPALLLVCLCAALAAGCGDNEMRGGGGDDDGGDDDGVTPDANVPPPDAEIMPDAMVCPVPLAGRVGAPCTVSTDCDSAPGAADGFCFVGLIGPDTYAPEGYCVLDDFTGIVCATDADCGEGGQCVDSDGYKWCLPACGCAGSDPDVCPPNQACFDTFLYPLDKASCVPGSATAEDGDACAGVYQCNEGSQCFNDFENPGGVCQTTGCTIGNDETCHGGTCVALDDFPAPGLPLCVDSCTTDADCRGPEGYKCFDPGDGAAKYCRHAHSGDACTTKADCGGGVWECLTADGFTGGYCTQIGCPNPGTTEACTLFSICATSGAQNICADRCDLTADPTTCRNGYTCQNVGAGGGACLPVP